MFRFLQALSLKLDRNLVTRARCVRSRSARKFYFEQLEDRRVLSSSTINLDAASAVTDSTLARIDNSLAMISTGFTGLDLTANDIGVPGDYGFWQWKDGAIGITAVAASNPEALAEDLTRLGMNGASTNGQLISGFLPTTSIAALTSLETLRFASPAPKPINYVGSTTSGGDVAQRAKLVRDFAGLTGAGVRVGIISDSFDNLGAGSAAADVASGDLPGVGNPNGFTTPVTILSDNVAGTDEGRAMAQIVHDVAPGAELLFSNLADANGMQNTGAYADNIRALRENGADIIVDDIVFPSEPFFMDGIVSRAINEVVADGAVHFSAAGNNAADSYESSFVSSGVTQSLTLGGVTRSELLHDFDPGPGVDTRQRISFPSGTSTILFQWDDPFITDAPTSGGAVRDFDIYAFLPDGTLFRGGVSSMIGGDAFEILQIPLFLASPIDIVIGLRNGTNPGGFLKYIIINEAPAADILEYDTASATAFGHVNASGVIGVGASFYQQTPEFGDNPAILFPSSSVGGIDILFDTDGNRLAQPETRFAIDIVAPTGGNTTFFGSLDPVGTGPFEADGFRNFFGTSAAAPHAAALAALLLQLDPSLGPAGVEMALEDSAIDMDNPFTAGFDIGVDAATGAGFVDALGAIGLVQDTPQLVGLDPNEYILVDDTRDLLDANPNDGVIDVDLGMPGQQVSMRAATIAANAGGTNATTLLVPRGNYNLTLTGTESANTNDLDITANTVTIIGTGAGETIIDGTGLSADAGASQDRIFDVSGSAAALVLSDLTLTNATSTVTGGAILVTNGATVELDRVAVIDNSSGTQVGGGIRSASGSTLIVRNSVFTGNSSASVGGAIYASGALLTLGGNVFAHNVADTRQNVFVSGSGTIYVNEGNNLTDDNAGNHFDTAYGDHIGSVDYVVTSVADTYDHADDAYALSVREAIDLANDPGLDEIWLPAWNFMLTRERTSAANQTEIDVSQGDLDIYYSLTLRGIGGSTSVGWRAGAAVDKIFELLGDYDDDGLSNGAVGSEDYTIWRDTLGSTTDLRADGDDNGTVQQADWNVWINHWGNTLTRVGV